MRRVRLFSHKLHGFERKEEIGRILSLQYRENQVVLYPDVSSVSLCLWKKLSIRFWRPCLDLVF